MTPSSPLYRVVETLRLCDRAITQVGPVWQPSLEQARRAAYRMSVSVNCLRIHIEDSHGRIVERLYAEAQAA